MNLTFSVADMTLPLPLSLIPINSGTSRGAITPLATIEAVLTARYLSKIATAIV
jgi:hypothetical protein